MAALPTRVAYALDCQPKEQRWLIDQLWADQAVGIVGGEPKCCKSFLALDMAVAVASGKPCVGRFAPIQTGRVLLYAAEDALHVVRERLDGIAHARQSLLEHLDIHVVTVPTLRLDVDIDRTRLVETVALLRPKMLVLDPFVRLHRCDENASGDVAPLLAFLREIQRRFGVAIVVVHHAKKGGGRIRPGQALRGSSEFHAWGDSNLYLRRDGHKEQRLILGVEHRAAKSPEPLHLALLGDEEMIALCSVEMRAEPIEATVSIQDQIIRVLRDAEKPLTMNELRELCRVRMQRMCNIVADLAEKGRVTKSNGGWVASTK